MDYLTVCLKVLSGSEESEQVTKRYLLSIHKYDLWPNLFNASHEISRNQGANLGAKNIYIRIQCIKCGGYLTYSG